MEFSNGLEFILPYLGDKIRQAIERFEMKNNIQEIRYRLNRALTVYFQGKEYFLTSQGGITEYPQLGMTVTQQDIDFSLKAVCDYSIHSFQREISEGFVTIRGGNRVGICGTAVIRDNKIETLKYINGLNFRVAREIYGSADEIIEKCFSDNVNSVLIIGSPSSGKTTVLRDLCRQLGNLHKISVIDERGELAAVYQGYPQNDVGTCTDVFDGYPKQLGILTAIRVMSPKIIAVDEIGGENDCRAIENAIHTGVNILATAHASSADELNQRKALKSLLKQKAFSKIVLLGNRSETGKILSVTDVK